MNKKLFLKAIDRVIELKLKAADIFIKEMVEVLGDIGTPEQVVGKKYADWTMEDMAILQTVFPPEELNAFIAKRAIAQVKKLEEEVKAFEGGSYA